MKDINIYLIVIMIVIIIKNIFTPVVEGNAPIEEDTPTEAIIGNPKTDKTVPKNDDIDNHMKTLSVRASPKINDIISRQDKRLKKLI